MPNCSEYTQVLDQFEKEAATTMAAAAANTNATHLDSDMTTAATTQETVDPSKRVSDADTGAAAAPQQPVPSAAATAPEPQQPGAMDPQPEQKDAMMQPSEATPPDERIPDEPEQKDAMMHAPEAPQKPDERMPDEPEQKDAMMHAPEAPQKPDERMPEPSVAEKPAADAEMVEGQQEDPDFDEAMESEEDDVAEADDACISPSEDDEDEDEDELLAPVMRRPAAQRPATAKATAAKGKAKAKPKPQTKKQPKAQAKPKPKSKSLAKAKAQAKPKATIRKADNSKQPAPKGASRASTKKAKALEGTPSITQFLAQSAADLS